MHEPQAVANELRRVYMEYLNLLELWLETATLMDNLLSREPLNPKTIAEVVITLDQCQSRIVGGDPETARDLIAKILGKKNFDEVPMHEWMLSIHDFLKEYPPADGREIEHAMFD